MKVTFRLSTRWTWYFWFFLYIGIRLVETVRHIFKHICWLQEAEDGGAFCMLCGCSFRLHKGCKRALR
jgi:hypothetical protein